MIFADKIPSSRQLGTVYHNLQSCILRLEYALTSTPSTPNPRASVGSYLLKCFTVQLDHQVRGLEESREGPSKYKGILIAFTGEKTFLDFIACVYVQQADTLHTFIFMHVKCTDLHDNQPDLDFCCFRILHKLIKSVWCHVR